MNNQYVYENGVLHDCSTLCKDDYLAIKADKLEVTNGSWICGVQWTPGRSCKPVRFNDPLYVNERKLYPHFKVSKGLRHNGYSQRHNYVITETKEECEEAYKLLISHLCDKHIEVLTDELFEAKEQMKRLKERRCK